MTRSTPARLLAPLALVTVAVALFLVVSAGTSDPAESPAPSSATTSTTKGDGASKAKPKPKRSTGRRRYTVKPGDTPSGIAEKTGVSVAKLLELNPDLNPQALSPGEALKLR